MILKSTQFYLTILLVVSLLIIEFVIFFSANCGKQSTEIIRDGILGMDDEVGDMGSIPERETVKAWWNGKDEPPITAKPEVTITTDGEVISGETPGASIGYRTMKLLPVGNWFSRWEMNPTKIGV